MPTPRMIRLFFLAFCLTTSLISFDADAAHFVVSSAADISDPNLGDGICGDSLGCTLRAAVAESNALAGTDTITFSPGMTRISLVNGPIELIDSGTVILGQVGEPTIDGLLNTYNSCLIRINSGCTVAGLTLRRSRSHGIEIVGSNNRVGGNTPSGTIIIGGCGLDNDSASGVWIHGALASGNVVAGCYIGTTSNGGMTDPNPYGITIGALASHSQIGSTSDSFHTLVSGNNLTGIRFTGNASDNQVLNCVIGTDITGARALPNLLGGILIDKGAHHNRFGGDSVATRNLISGNQTAGIVIEGSETKSNIVSGNLIGLDATGTLPLGNNGPGIVIQDRANNTMIGDSTSSRCNVISGNDGDGIRICGTGTDDNVVLGNFVGVDTSGYASIGNGWQSGHGIFIGDGASRNRIGGASSQVGNVISGNLGSGICISNSNENVVLGNMIGVSVGSISSAPNAAGVTVRDGSSFNTIGGTEPGAGNVISGNRAAIFPLGTGVAILGSGTNNNRVVGNMIGADITGTRPLRNGSCGVLIADSAQHNVIGGSSTAERNIISGNGFGSMTVELGVGVHLFGAGTSYNEIRGNYVGVGLDGISPVLNLGNGIGIYDGASDNTIGGASDQDANLIVSNRAYGIYITDTTTSLNTVRKNRIYNNGSSGIVIRRGAQNNVTPPILTRTPPDSACGTSSAVGGIVDVYRAAPDPSGCGEGSMVIGSNTVDQTGHFAVAVMGTNIGDTITALVTDSGGSTSQFSQNFIVQDPMSADESTDGSRLPSTFTLSQNYPNPFNMTTVIHYSLPQPSDVELSIYDLLGRKVAILASGRQPAGEHKEVWDGKDDNERSVGSGVYFCRLSSGNLLLHNKMLLLK